MRQVEIVAALIKKENKIFLVKRKMEPFRNLWIFPGGRKEKGESFEEGAKREVKEETGLDVKIIKKLEPLKIIINKKLIIIHVFFCETTSKKYFIDKEESLDGGWFDIDKALNSEFGLIPQLKKYLENDMD